MDLGLQRVVIVDTSATGRATVSRTLSMLGVRSKNLFLAGSYAEGESLIRKHDPGIVITEYNLGAGKTGTDLIATIPDRGDGLKGAILVLVTSDESLHVLAESREVGVDLILKKPFTADSIRNDLSQLFLGKSLDALEELRRGRFMNEATRMREELFLRREQLEYKVKVQGYERALADGRHEEAFQAAEKISTYFAAQPRRLVEMLRLSVQTRRFDKIEEYFSFYTALSERSETLTDHMAAALVTAGKHYLRKGAKDHALDLFNKAGVICAGRVRILKQIVQALIDQGMAEYADPFLRRFSQEEQKSVDYRVLDFQVANQVYDAIQVLNRGRDLLASEVRHERIYEILIARALECGLAFSARTWAQEAVLYFDENSDQCERFRVMLKSIPAVAPR